MKTRNQEVLQNKFINLNNESIDLHCAICKEILNQPVTLPCSHNFCKNCLDTSIKLLSQLCPCCRKRFSHWYRQAIKENQLISENLWKKIQDNYGDLLVNPDKTTENTGRGVLSEIHQNHPQLSKTGEIHKEYLESLEKFEKEINEKKTAEEIASKNLILQLYKEEFKNPKSPKNKENMLVAGPSHAYQCIGGRSQATTAGSSLISGRGSINKSSTSVITISSTSPSCSSSMSNNYSLLKSVAAVVTRGTEIIKQKVSQRIFTKKDDQNFSSSPSLLYPTKTHKYSSIRRSVSVESNDSLKSEIRDFKPIRTAPTTPKKLSGEILRIPSVRPESVVSVKELPFSPSASSLSPINTNLPGRRSAFSVVSSIFPVASTPKVVVPSKSAKSSPPKRGGGATGGRKRKSSSSTASSQNTPEETVVTVVHVPKSKKLKTNPEPVAGPSKTSKRANGRITRSTSYNKLNGVLDSSHESIDEKEQNLLKKAIIEQEKLEKMLEQERKDFEFAKRLQKKLNKAEQGQIRTEYGLRKTRSGKTRTNGMITETKVVTKKVEENHINGRNNGKRNITTKNEEKSPILRRSTRKRH